MLDNYKSFNINVINEDVIVAMCMNHSGVQYHNPVNLNYKWGLVLNHRDVYHSTNFIYYFSDYGFQKMDIDNKILHYRINNTPKREFDYFKYLMENIYGI